MSVFLVISGDQGQSQLSRPIHVVVSLGTGRLPLRSINACDVFRPEGLFDLAQVALGAKNLGELFVDQVWISLVVKCNCAYLGTGHLNCVLKLSLIYYLGNRKNM